MPRDPEKIRRALAKGVIPTELLKQRDSGYEQDIGRLSREYKAFLRAGNYAAARATLLILITAAAKHVRGLSVHDGRLEALRNTNPQAREDEIYAVLERAIR